MNTTNPRRRTHLPHHPAVPAPADPYGSAPDPVEALRQVEDEIGINDWIDPETGEPAEGHSPPRIEEE